ncbi:MAG: class I SAM-dependent methyltransferase [Methanobrevibacter sp.]|jgi:tRNA (cmo5U34)-methyltransferase|nr:class I SAM-dependent methyltransferase [Candidatus Methanovirga meridionalis]
MDLKEEFDKVSKEYDGQRRELIHCFDDFYKSGINFLEFKYDDPKVLDLGAGTGLFSSFVLNKFPKSSLTLIDLSSEMLQLAKERFKDYSNVEYIVDDYLSHEFNEKFDIVISSLSIHHLSDCNKAKLYKKVHGLINNKGGIFLNADQSLSQSTAIEIRFNKYWKECIENSSLKNNEIENAYKRMIYDNPATLKDQFKWFKNAGFNDFDLLYKYYNFTVMYGKS